MAEKVAASHSDQLQQLKKRLDEWRAGRTVRTRLPDEFWAAAVEIASQQGIYPTAHALRLDYTALKKKVATASQPAHPAPAQFVELLNSAGEIPAECLIDVEGARDGRMRIQMKLTPAQIASLILAWRASEA